MSDLVSQIFLPSKRRPMRSSNGLAMFCALVCMLTFGFSYFTARHETPQPSEEFFELAADLKNHFRENSTKGLEELNPSMPASHHEQKKDRPD